MNNDKGIKLLISAQNPSFFWDLQIREAATK